MMANEVSLKEGGDGTSYSRMVEDAPNSYYFLVDALIMLYINRRRRHIP